MFPILQNAIKAFYFLGQIIIIFSKSPNDQLPSSIYPSIDPFEALQSTFNVQLSFFFFPSTLHICSYHPVRASHYLSSSERKYLIKLKLKGQHGLWAHRQRLYVN